MWFTNCVVERHPKILTLNSASEWPIKGSLCPTVILSSAYSCDNGRNWFNKLSGLWYPLIVQWKHWHAVMGIIAKIPLFHQHCLSQDIWKIHLYTGKPAELSDTKSDYNADKAVDGIYEPPSGSELSSLAHSNTGNRPWWRVDLQNIYCVFAVNILNRSRMFGTLIK